MEWTYTPAWNLLGTPAMSVPMGPIDSRLPSGLQIIGARFDDATVRRVADAYQQVTDWHTRLPECAQVAGCRAGGLCIRRLNGGGGGVWSELVSFSENR